ncbi:hypothetical protein IJ21_11120 [Paenibacillus sp. 32O-W]|nr:hypothetical protein IJ21_11120 [Paenibacillus sp. 32O-W]
MLNISGSMAYTVSTGIATHNLGHTNNGRRRLKHETDYRDIRQSAIGD